MAAGVDEAYGFAAVSDGDNSNVLAARVVRETYGVENVVARISDQGRADVYQRMGISTVAPVPWTSAQILSRLLPATESEAYSDPSAEIMMRRVRISDGWVGKPYAEVEAAVRGRIAYVVRFNQGIVPDSGTLVQEGDEPYLVTTTADAARADKVLSKQPGAADAAARGASSKRKAAKK
jgi:trk system potassium uptake protein TrkA